MRTKSISKLSKLLGNGNFFEGARWHDNSWWVSDLYARKVLKIDESGDVTIVTTLEDQPSGLGWLPDNSLLCVSMMKMRLIRITSDGRSEEYKDLSSHGKGFLNDMAVDRKGRAYVGSAGFGMFDGERPAQGAVLRVDPDGSVTVASAELDFPNGIVITPDSKNLIVAETFGPALTIFDIDENGDLKNRRRLITFGRPPSWSSVEEVVKVNFGPDGCALDRDGYVWVADAIGGKVSRISPSGEIEETIWPPEGYGVYTCALGGSDKRTLLMCCAPSFDRDFCIKNSEAAIFTCKVDVPCS